MIKQFICVIDAYEKELKLFQDEVVSLVKRHKYPRGTIVNIDETGINFHMPSNYT